MKLRYFSNVRKLSTYGMHCLQVIHWCRCPFIFVHWVYNWFREVDLALACKFFLSISDKYQLMTRFDYLYHTMNIPHKQMTQWPQIFRTRLSILKQRHGFLEKIGRAQYNPTKENYVSLHKLVGNDVTFCKETAKRPSAEFNDYLKSLWWSSFSFICVQDSFIPLMPWPRWVEWHTGQFTTIGDSAAILAFLTHCCQAKSICVLGGGAVGGFLDGKHMECPSL
jgi:hypothetical protein